MPSPSARLGRLMNVRVDTTSSEAMPAASAALSSAEQHCCLDANVLALSLPCASTPAAGTNGHRIHYTHNVPSMLPIHRDLISRGMHCPCLRGTCVGRQRGHACHFLPAKHLPARLQSSSDDSMPPALSHCCLPLLHLQACAASSSAAITTWQCHTPAARPGPPGWWVQPVPVWLVDMSAH